MVNKKRIFMVFAIIAVLLSSIVSIENSHSAPNAFACGQMGSYMGRSRVNTVFNNVIKPDEPNRKWTVEELFRWPTTFTSYNGEGEGDWLYIEKVDRGKARVGEAAWNASGVQENLKAARGLNCLIGRGDVVPNALLKLSSSVTSVINLTVSGLIGEDIMADGLLEIIGGGDEGGGLIGTFTNSIYMPLVILAFIMTVVTIIYKGLIQMKLREAIMSVIWSVGAFVIGLALMLNPKLLAGAPQQATTAITTCVIGAMSGQNCLTNEVTAPVLLAGNECRSEIMGGDNDVSVVINSMNCTIWKSFVLEPWAQEQFGAPYSQLYTHNIPEGGGEWSNLPEGEGEKYCVNLASTKSASESVRNIEMDLNSDSTVCNVALYQLYLKTEMTDPVNHAGDGFTLTNPSGEGDPYDARWYDIIVPMAQDNSNWQNWSGQGRFLSRLGTSFISFVSTTLAAVILFSLSIFGAAYKVISVIMMAFAPLFFLFAIDPNRGRKIFLGWLETLFASILKYFAISMLIVVSLVLYSGILSNTSGMTSFIAVIILTVALWMYRKEVVDLIGASNMGGQTLSNKTKKLIDSVQKEVKEKGSAYVGGQVGGAVGAMDNRKENIKNRRANVAYLNEQLSQASSPEARAEINAKIKAETDAIDAEGTRTEIMKKGAKMGGKESFNRAMKRGTSVTATAYRQLDMTRKALEKSDKIDAQNRGNLLQKTANGTNNETLNGPGTTPDENINSTLDTINTPELARALGIDKQRKPVEYSGNLSSEETQALDAFANQLKQLSNNDEILDIANNKKQMADLNKQKLVHNEINARLKFNSLNGEASGKLSRHELADSKYISDEELKVNVSMHRANYLETGNPEEYEKYKSTILERSARGDIDPNVANRIVETALKQREKIEKSGKEYVRSESVPTEKNLEEKAEKYINKEKIFAPEELKKEEKKRVEIEENKNNQGDKSIEFDKQRQVGKQYSKKPPQETQPPNDKPNKGNKINSQGQPEKREPQEKQSRKDNTKAEAKSNKDSQKRVQTERPENSKTKPSENRDDVDINNETLDNDTWNPPPLG